MNIKQLITNYLSTNTKPITAYELSTKLHYHSETVKSALSELVSENKVTVIKNKVNTNGGQQLTNFYKIK